MGKKGDVTLFGAVGALIGGVGGAAGGGLVALGAVAAVGAAPVALPIAAGAGAIGAGGAICVGVIGAMGSYIYHEKQENTQKVSQLNQKLVKQDEEIQDLKKERDTFKDRQNQQEVKIEEMQKLLTKLFEQSQGPSMPQAVPILQPEARPQPRLYIN